MPGDNEGRPRGRPRREPQELPEDIRRGYRKGSNHGYGPFIPTSKAIAYETMKYLELLIAAADLESRDFTQEERRKVVDHLYGTLRKLRRRSSPKETTSYAILPAREKARDE